uniref:Nucleoside phosphorylase domain-containing protein n=1 Tax=Chloropicon primus TaxID=1764295 RepID=A0A7S2T5I1_9CHLO
MTKTVVIVMAMEAEAKPFVEHLQLKKDETIFLKGFKAECYAGSLDTTKVYLILNGKCHKYNVDIVGTVGGAVTTFAAIQALHPDVIINAGTCGGFKAMGGEVGSIYLCTRFLNHDRRIAIPGFDAFGVGELKTVDLNQGLLDHVGAKNGVVSTGNSLDMVKEDEHYIKLHKATCKDMEGEFTPYYEGDGWFCHSPSSSVRLSFVSNSPKGTALNHGPSTPRSRSAFEQGPLLLTSATSWGFLCSHSSRSRTLWTASTLRRRSS